MRKARKDTVQRKNNDKKNDYIEKKKNEIKKKDNREKER